MGKLRDVPGWVQRPRLVVSGTEDFLLWLFGETGAPEALGARTVLAWLGGLEEAGAPMTHRLANPTRARALAEFAVAHAISIGAQYPTTEWFGSHGLAPDDLPTRAFWEAHAGYESTRSYALGAAVALGWVLGVIDDPGLLTPTYREDGGTLPDGDRAACARVLRTLSVQPLPAPARPVLSPRPACVGRSWIA